MDYEAKAQKLLEDIQYILGCDVANSRLASEDLLSATLKQAADEAQLEILARWYNAETGRRPASSVADLCDDELDKSGGLLGRVRNKADSLRKLSDD